MTRIAQVYYYQPETGRAMEMLGHFAEAKALIIKAGAADVVVAQSQGGTSPGTFVFQVQYESGATFGSTVDGLATNQAWLDFWARISVNPAGKLVRHEMFTGVDI
jgi:hypothetical protein